MKLEIDHRPLLVLLFLVVLALVLPTMHETKKPQKQADKPQPKPESKPQQPIQHTRRDRREDVAVHHEDAKAKFMRESNDRFFAQMADVPGFKKSDNPFSQPSPFSRKNRETEIVINAEAK